MQQRSKAKMCFAITFLHCSFINQHEIIYGKKLFMLKIRLLSMLGKFISFVHFLIHPSLKNYICNYTWSVYKTIYGCAQYFVKLAKLNLTPQICLPKPYSEFSGFLSSSYRMLCTLNQRISLVGFQRLTAFMAAERNVVVRNAYYFGLASNNIFLL